MKLTKDLYRWLYAYHFQLPFEGMSSQIFDERLRVAVGILDLRLHFKSLGATLPAKQPG
jgi:hypothetical protein